MDNKSIPLLTLPSAIVIAGVIIAGSIIYALKPTTPVANQNGDSNGNPVQQQKITVSPITKADHILGNPNAKIKIVEYSDPSCPFCKTFNPTMVKVMDTYGASGTVAWVYRSFPLDKARSDGFVLHPNAGHEAQALECAASVGGNDKFWAFEKSWYNVFPLQGATNRTVAEDTKQLVSIAKDVGIDTVAFNDCLSSGTNKAVVEKQYQMGINDGVQGTPFSLIVTSTGKVIPINGAQPFEAIKGALDSLIAEVK